MGQGASAGGESSLYPQGFGSSTFALAQSQSPSLPLLSPVSVHPTSVPLSFINEGLLEVDDFFKDCSPTLQTIPSETQEPPNLGVGTNFDTPSGPVGRQSC